MEKNILGFPTTQPSLVAFLDRSRIQLYGGGLPKVISLDFSPTVVQDIEVVDKKSLAEQIKTWILQHKVAPAPVVLVLSEAIYFTRQLAKPGQGKEDEDLRTFLDMVPFETVQTKHYPVADGFLVVAASGEFLETVVQALGLGGLPVAAVVPQLLLGSIGAKRWLDEEMGKYVLNHADSLRAQSLIDLSQVGRAVSPPSSTLVTANKRLFVFGGLFVILITILIFLLLAR